VVELLTPALPCRMRDVVGMFRSFGALEGVQLNSGRVALAVDAEGAPAVYHAAQDADTAPGRLWATALAATRHIDEHGSAGMHMSHVVLASLAKNACLRQYLANVPEEVGARAGPVHIGGGGVRLIHSSSLLSLPPPLQASYRWALHAALRSQSVMFYWLLRQLYVEETSGVGVFFFPFSLFAHAHTTFVCMGFAE